MSTLFRVTSFQYDGKIVTIDQISFVGPDLSANHPNSLNVPNMQVVSPSSLVNYMATCSMSAPTDE